VDSPNLADIDLHAQVNPSVLINPDDTLVSRLGTNFSMRLSAANTILDVFPGPPLEKHLHILVQVQSPGGK
jgi:hypothetical protein